MRRAAGRAARLQEVARDRGNVFAELLETVKVASLGQISARSTKSAASTAATCSGGSPRLLASMKLAWL